MPATTTRGLCQSVSPAVAAAWTSEDPQERARAAAICGGCPLAADCLSTAHQERVTAGVWGGVDFTVRWYTERGSFDYAVRRRHEVSRSTVKFPRQRKAAELLAEIELLLSGGSGPAEVLSRLGMSGEWARRQCRRAGREDLAVRLLGVGRGAA